MGNLGRYQDVVEEMYEAGGVDKWIDIIKEAAYTKGSADMKNILVGPLLTVGVALGVVGVISYQRISKWISKKKEERLLSEKEVAEAEVFLKKELADAIKEVEKESRCDAE